jgi:hypothetical protein
MLTIEKTVLISPEQMQMVVEGMRNPKNSWDRSDSAIEYIEDPETMQTADWQFHLGEADHELMRTLAASGSVHAKYRRMIPVMMTINAPLYWWKEFDTYKVGTVANSCSTMHKIHAKPFDISDFSCEHLFCLGKNAGFGELPIYNGERWDAEFVLEILIKSLNHYRTEFLETKDKKYWWQLIQLLPSSYNQKRTIMLNYEVLSHIYKDRKDHKLDEWHVFCNWIKQLPYADLIIPEMDISEELMTVNEMREKCGLERVEDVSFLVNIREESNNE